MPQSPLLDGQTRDKLSKTRPDAIKLIRSTSKLLEDCLKHMDEIQLKLDLVYAHDSTGGDLVSTTNF